VLLLNQVAYSVPLTVVGYGCNVATPTCTISQLSPVQRAMTAQRVPPSKGAFCSRTSSTQICLRGNSASAIREGDSGGPALLSVNGSWSQVGITDVGWADNTSAPFYSGFTSVSSEHSWINGQLATYPELPATDRFAVTSYDNMRAGAPYNGYFATAWQGFPAASNTITYLGVTVGNPALPSGPVAAAVTVRLCSDPNCVGVLASVSVPVTNYGNSALDIGDIAVTRGATYFIVWYQPAPVSGTTWATYWWAGGPSISQSDQMQAVVRGYDR